MSMYVKNKIGKIQWTVYTDIKKYTQTKKKYIYTYVYKDTINIKDAIKKMKIKKVKMYKTIKINI